MYVDKILNDVKAIQTLSRLNRCMFGKVDTCVLDFANKSEEIMKSFSRFYKQIILEGETDPNKLYDILNEIEGCQVYTDTLVDECVRVFLENGDRALIDSMLVVLKIIKILMKKTKLYLNLGQKLSLELIIS